MSAPEVISLLQDFATRSECDPDLEYSLEYVELSRLAQGVPDVEYGDMRRPAEEPDWSAVRALALRLLGKSRDLRLAVHLVRASLPLDGFSGLESGLALIEGLLEQHWEQVHPQLDPDDAGDPTARISTLAALNDKEGLVHQVFLAPLVELPACGWLCLRDIDVGGGSGEGLPDAAVIDEAFAMAALDELNEVVSVLARAADRVGRIELLLTARVGHGQAIRFKELSQSLRHAGSVMAARLQRHPQWGIRGDAEIDLQPGDAVSPTSRPFDEIARSEDVVRMLDRICDYYAREAPASPVPLLLQRAKRLARMSFLEIISDLSPQSLAEINRIAGTDKG